jgi:hypothetical protein
MMTRIMITVLCVAIGVLLWCFKGFTLTRKR